MHSINLRKLALLALTAGVVSALAQTTPPTTTPATCTTAPTSLTALNLERAVALTGLSSTATPNIPAATAAAIAGGALELRQQLTLNSTTNVITLTDFTAQPSSTSPTPVGNIQFSSVLSSESFTVDKVYASCQPKPSLLITGFITQNYPVSPVGNLIGAPAAISIGYTTDNPPKVNNVVIVYAGVASIYSGAAVGTLTFPTSSVVPPGSNSGAPVIVVAGGLNQSTAQKQVGLDFSQTTSPLNLPITFAVTQIAPPLAGGAPGSGIPQVAIVNVTGTGQALITFAGGKGTYAFQIAATDTGGRVTNQVVVFQYNGI